MIWIFVNFLEKSHIESKEKITFYTKREPGIYFSLDVNHQVAKMTSFVSQLRHLI